MAATLGFRAPSFSPRVEEVPRIRSVQFGDGYQGRYGDGLNTMLLKAEVPWNALTPVEFDALKGFLRTHRGIAWFHWALPGDVSRKWICSSWSWQRTEGSPANRPAYDVMARFEEVADLIG